MLMEAAPPLVGRRYLLHEQIGKGGMGEVYRATDRLHNQQVALKRVLTSTDWLETASISNSLDFRVALAQEFKILASLRHPHIISVLDYGFDAENQPFIVMELLENAQTILEAGHNQPLAKRVEMLIQVLQALAYLHRRGILHRDLKPANLLVGTDGKVKMLDFGLSIARGEVSDEDAYTSGTLSYMAPEVIEGRAPSELSDLYAVGTIAYELLTGQHPFNKGNISQMLHDVLQTPPDLQRVVLDPRLEEVLGKLLQKDPADRYQSAAEVLEFYADSTNQQHLLENEATRESFLQAARFVGRDAEIAILNKALSAARQGQGSAWLVGGESGVGKTRLLDETRIHALVDQMLVLRGQATREKTVTYQLWRGPLRWLTLQTDLSDLEASVLKELIPDIETLLERPIPDAPRLDSQATQERLLEVIENIFLRQTQPIVLIMEDLHWVGSASLKVISRLTRHIADFPLVLIGSYRNDERQDLPSELPEMKSLPLERLGEAAIAELSESMLGREGREKQVVELLQRESEGNVFFLVEVVRALAERAGQLQNVAYMTLPSSIFAGGMQQLVERRLSHVPAPALPMLELAAVMGRKLNLALLKHAYPQTDLDGWLTLCSNAAVLDVFDEQWQFAHDKIREGIMAKLSDGQKISLHEQAAQTIESVYGTDPTYTGLLAYHWSNTSNTAKAIAYLDKAGEQSVESYANQEAIHSLTQAAQLDKTPDPTRLLHRETLLGRAYLGAGKLPESRVHLEKALQLLGYALPNQKARLVGSLLVRLGQQIGHRSMGMMRPARSHDKQEKLLDAVRVYEKLSEITFYNGDVPRTIYCSMSTLNLSERAGISPELARAYANMAVVAGLVGMTRLGDVYVKNALNSVDAVKDDFTRARTISRVALYACGLGRWQEAEAWLTEAMQIADKIGDSRQWGESAAVKSNVLHLTARFEDSRLLCIEIANRSARTGDVQHQTWGSNYQAQSVLRMDQWELAYELLVATRQQLKSRPDLLTTRIINNGLLALTQVRRGETKNAHHLAHENLKLIGESRAPNVFSLFEGYIGTAEALLLLAEQDTMMLSEATTAVDYLKRFTHRFPIGQARTWLLTGKLQKLRGENPHEAWQKSLNFARHYQMPYDETLASDALKES